MACISRTTAQLGRAPNPQQEDGLMDSAGTEIWALRSTSGGGGDTRWGLSRAADDAPVVRSRASGPNPDSNRGQHKKKLDISGVLGPLAWLPWLTRVGDVEGGVVLPHVLDQPPPISRKQVPIFEQGVVGWEGTRLGGSILLPFAGAGHLAGGFCGSGRGAGISNRSLPNRMRGLAYRTIHSK
eukprot:1394778-Amorphochlora_amoeboformis.AAC.1